MSDSEQPQWQALTFCGKIYAIYKLPGMSQWRYLRKGDEKLTFATESAARDAARDRALAILFPKMHSTATPTEKSVSDALGVEQWLKVKRADARKAETIHRAGKRQLKVMRGRA